MFSLRLNHVVSSWNIINSTLILDEHLKRPWNCFSVDFENKCKHAGMFVIICTKFCDEKLPQWFQFHCIYPLENARAYSTFRRAVECCDNQRSICISGDISDYPSKNLRKDQSPSRLKTKHKTTFCKRWFDGHASIQTENVHPHSPTITISRNC